MRREPCGGDSEKDSGEQRYSESERKNRHRWSCADWNVACAMKGKRDHNFHAKKRDHQPENASEDGEHDAFGERLPDQAAARCAEGQAYRCLSAARCSACKQEVGDIGTGDQEYECADGK